jgi:protein-disulfide isomerase
MFRLLALLALLAGLAGPAAATDLTKMSTDERAAFREEVRAYLMENPEVIMEAVQALQDRQAQQQQQNDAALVANNSDAIFNDGISHVAGNPDGDVTLVEFMDYRCTYCRRAFPELQSLVKKDGNIRIIYKEFPILGDESVLASRFAISAQLLNGEAAYDKLHNAMMQMRGNFTTDALVALATELGLDGHAIVAGMTDPRVDQIIGANHALAQTLAISGTPTFVLGDQMIRGYVPLDGMKQLVAQTRDQQG